MASKKIEVTKLDRESKILLLTILKQGYITEEQKQAFSSLLDVKTDAIFFVYSREQLEEIKIVMRKAKVKIHEYNLPIVPDIYQTELKEAMDAVKEIVKELEIPLFASFHHLYNGLG